MVKERFNSWIPKAIGMGAITLLPLGIFYRYDRQEVESDGYHYIRRHEWQHVSQYRSMGFWKFYTAYLWQALRAGFKHDSLPLEQEAIAHEMDKTWPDNCSDHP